MSLFPAYAPDGNGSIKCEEAKGLKRQWRLEVEPEVQEAALLASDSEEEPTPRAAPPSPPAHPLTPAPGASEEPFYIDKKADNANLRVTTLYYPGRPIYRRAHGARAAAGAEGRRERRRYHLQATPSGGDRSAEQAGERARALRRLLAERPRDEDLWLRYIHFQQEWADAAAWRAAAEEARRSGADTPRLRAALHAARAASLPPRDLLAAVSEDLAQEKREEVQLEGWLRLLWALGGAAGTPPEVERAAAAALSALQHVPRAYPLVLYAAGAALRAAGLWERLVLLLELVVAVNLPASAAFPPPRDPDRERDDERRLAVAEDAVIDSGLPLSTVWVRVERLRAAAHWRPSAAEGGGEVDPQRSASASELAPLLRAVRGGAALLLGVCALRLAQVPLLPASEAARRACAAGPHEPPEPLPAALCALARAQRRLPRAPLPPPALRAALAAFADPPHLLGDDYGYGSWTWSLWEAVWAGSAARGQLALVCWRLRYLHAVLSAAPPGGERRLRAQARRLLKHHAPGEPLAFALFARIEAAAGDAGGARRAALHAVRAAAPHDTAPRPHALYAARVLRELAPPGDPEAQHALLAAVHARPPPAAPTAPPPADELRAALHECSERCSELERRLAGEGEEEEEEADEAAARALTCGPGEWAAARVALLSPAERAAELARLLALPYDTVHRSAASVQYWESLALALAEAAGAARPRLARQLRHLFPNNALLALARSGWEECGQVSRTHVGALAQVVPALGRALAGGPGGAVSTHEWERVARACERAGRGGPGGAPLCAVRLEAETRAERTAPRAHRLLLAALHDHPNDKALYVAGARCVCSEAGALCDAVLERSLRAHALLHELHPAPPAPAPAGSDPA